MRTVTGLYGEVFAGGPFTTAGGQAASKIARWNGSVWQPLSTGLDGSDSVFATGLYRGDVIVGGTFTTAGCTPAPSIARWSEWGSCCVSGTCAIMSQSACESLGGVYQGAGIDCLQAPSCVPTTGACCVGGTAIEVTESQCSAVGGVFHGAGVPAASVTCDPICVADMNGDGFVNSLDLGILLASWSIPPDSPGCSK